MSSSTQVVPANRPYTKAGKGKKSRLIFPTPCSGPILLSSSSSSSSTSSLYSPFSSPSSSRSSSPAPYSYHTFSSSGTSSPCWSPSSSSETLDTTTINATLRGAPSPTPSLTYPLSLVVYRDPALPDKKSWGLLVETTAPPSRGGHEFILRPAADGSGNLSLAPHNKLVRAGGSSSSSPSSLHELHSAAAPYLTKRRAGPVRPNNAGGREHVATIRNIGWIAGRRYAEVRAIVEAAPAPRTVIDAHALHRRSGNTSSTTTGILRSPSTTIRASTSGNTNAAAPGWTTAHWVAHILREMAAQGFEVQTFTLQELENAKIRALRSGGGFTYAK